MTVINYDWDEIEDNVTEEYDGVGVTIADYTTEPGTYGNVISERRAGQDSYFHFDGIGSTLAITDSNGTVADKFSYTAFGESTVHIGASLTPFRYIGRKGYLSDTGGVDYLVRRRWYCARHGRWDSIDPLYSDLYSYCRNSPITRADPSGLWTILVQDGFYGCAGCTGGQVVWNYKLDESAAGDKLLIIQHIVKGHVIVYCNVDRPDCAGGEPPVGAKCKYTRVGSCYDDVLEHLGSISTTKTDAQDIWQYPTYGNCKDGCELEGVEVINSVVRAFTYDESRDPYGKKPTTEKWIPTGDVQCKDFLVSRFSWRLKQVPKWWRDESKWEAVLYYSRRFKCCQPVKKPGAESTMEYAAKVMGSDSIYRPQSDCCNFSKLPDAPLPL